MPQILIKKAVFAAAALAAFALATGSAMACTVPPASTPNVPAITLPDLTSSDEAQQDQTPPEHARRIVGLWKTGIYASSQLIDQAFETFHSDGTEILIDQTPPAEDNVCLGVWEAVSHRTVKLKHPSWTFDSSGNLTGTAIIRAKVTLDDDADSFSGPTTVDYYDNSGKFIGHFDGQVKATRIKPD